ncbi:MAG: hypothetical protein H7Y61_05670, partial [Rhizobiales bacterium]|nr:hypothetical protein [Rhizobacter sp.]
MLPQNPSTAAVAPSAATLGNPLPPITYPESLPVSARRDEIAQALALHQV